MEWCQYCTAEGCADGCDFTAWVHASRVAQGLPPTVEDPAVLARIAVLMTDPLTA
jgi:hypothetical protein